MGKGKRQPELEVVRVPLAEMHGYEGNAKQHTNAQLDAVRKSISEFGFVNPVLAWHDADGRAVIVAGHARCQGRGRRASTRCRSCSSTTWATRSAVRSRWPTTKQP